MTIWLLVLGVVFFYLAWDARHFTSATDNTPYEVGATARGEPLSGVPLHEQLRRKAWHRRHGLGGPGQIAWVWAVLAIGCFAGAIVGTLG